MAQAGGVRAATKRAAPASEARGAIRCPHRPTNAGDALAHLGSHRPDKAPRLDSGTRMKAGRSHGIPLNTDAVKVLRELRTLNPERAHVFQWRRKPVDDCNGHAFKDAATRAGMPDLRWHDL